MKITPFTFDSLIAEEQMAPDAVMMRGVEIEPEALVEEAPAPTFDELQLEEAKQKSYDEGFIAGKSEGLRESEKQNQEAEEAQNQVLEIIANQLQQLQQQQQQHIQSKQQELGSLVMSCANKIAGEALRKDPISDISTMIEQCVAALFDQSEITARVHPQVAGLLENKLPKSVVIEQDEKLQLNDCQLQWQHGSATRDSQAIKAELENIISHYFEAQENKEASAPEMVETKETTGDENE